MSDDGHSDDSGKGVRAQLLRPYDDTERELGEDTDGRRPSSAGTTWYRAVTEAGEAEWRLPGPNLTGRSEDSSAYERRRSPNPNLTGRGEDSSAYGRRRSPNPNLTGRGEDSSAYGRRRSPNPNLTGRGEDSSAYERRRSPNPNLTGRGEDSSAYERRRSPIVIDDPSPVTTVSGLDAKSGAAREIRYTTVKVIEKGTFGAVYQAKLVPSGKEIAIKKVGITSVSRFVLPKTPLASDKSLTSLSHPNVVDLEAFFYTEAEKESEVYLNLVLQYVQETMYRHYIQLKQPMPVLELQPRGWHH
ncbi:hypothetical protein C8R46DRAFT_1212373 [Mycena filopes]|nr:hypothetical protein C8R46DRAFT_1212373 [Mycena filopes]